MFGLGKLLGLGKAPAAVSPSASTNVAQQSNTESNNNDVESVSGNAPGEIVGPNKNSRASRPRRLVAGVPPPAITRNQLKNIKSLEGNVSTRRRKYTPGKNYNMMVKTPDLFNKEKGGNPYMEGFMRFNPQTDNFYINVPTPFPLQGTHKETGVPYVIMNTSQGRFYGRDAKNAINSYRNFRNVQKTRKNQIQKKLQNEYTAKVQGRAKSARQAALEQAELEERIKIRELAAKKRAAIEAAEAKAREEAEAAGVFLGAKTFSKPTTFNILTGRAKRPSAAIKTPELSAAAAAAAPSVPVSVSGSNASRGIRQGNNSKGSFSSVNPLFSRFTRSMRAPAAANAKAAQAEVAAGAARTLANMQKFRNKRAARVAARKAAEVPVSEMNVALAEAERVEEEGNAEIAAAEAAAENEKKANGGAPAAPAPAIGTNWSKVTGAALFKQGQMSPEMQALAARLAATKEGQNFMKARDLPPATNASGDGGGGGGASAAAAQGNILALNAKAEAEARARMAQVARQNNTGNGGGAVGGSRKTRRARSRKNKTRKSIGRKH